MEKLDRAFEIKSVSSSGVFAGYGSVYGVVDQGDDIVAGGAFTKSLASWAQKGRMPALLWQHNTRQPIGAYTKMVEDERGLYVEGQLALKTQLGAEAYELMKMGALSGLSIGFKSNDDTFDQKSGIRTIKQGDLYEVSVVTFPMNDDARIAAVKSVEGITDLGEAELYLREVGGVSRTKAKAIVARIFSIARRYAEQPEDEADVTKALALLQNRGALLAR